MKISKKLLRTMSRFLIKKDAMQKVQYCILFAVFASPMIGQEKDEEIVKLGVFEISATEGQGYATQDSVLGMKTRKNLLEIPQTISIISRDLIDDVAPFGASIVEVAKYGSSGVIPRNGYRFDTPMQRGFRSGGITRTGIPMPSHNSSDSATIESLEVIKGPANVLYGQRNSLAGVISINSKMPQQISSHMFKTSVFSEGGYRIEVDSTGSILKTANNSVLSYRTVIAREDRDSVLHRDANSFLDKKVFYQALTFRSEATTVSIIGEYMDDNHEDNATNYFFNEAGTALYEGENKWESFQPDWTYDNIENWFVQADVTHNFNDTWTARINYLYSDPDRHSKQLRNRGVPDFTAGTTSFSYIDRYNDNKFAQFSAHIFGNYEIGGFRNESLVGYSKDSQDNRTKEFSSTDFPSVSIYNPDMTTILEPGTPGGPTPVQRLYNGNPWNIVKSNVEHVFYSHTLYMLEDERLIMVAGLAHTKVDASFSTNEATRRFGLVYRATPRISLFANNSTTFDPNSRLDRDGNRLEPQFGEVFEVGLKANGLFDGRISGTLTLFSLEATNIPLLQSYVDGNGNIMQEYVPSGKSTNDGVELDISLHLADNWELIGTLYSGDVVNEKGDRVNDTAHRSASVYTSYRIASGALRNLRIGGGVFWTGSRKSNPIDIPPYHTTSAFVSYAKGHWNYRLSLQNLENEFYQHAGAGNLRVAARPGPPFSGTLSVAYRF